MTFSPRTLIGLSAALCIAVLALVLSLALRAPHIGFAFTADGDNRLVSTADGRVVAALVIDGVRHPVDGRLAIEEPDMLPAYADYNAFMALQSAATRALENGRLSLKYADGVEHPLAASPRHFSDLPSLFWLQVLFGIGGMMTGALVLAARPGEAAARIYALTGLGYLVFAPAAAVYSTRELFLDGELFRALSIANHFGALLFTGSLTALLWVYPMRLARLPMLSIIAIVTLATFLADTFQITDTLAQYQFSVLVIYAASFAFAGMQWWQTRRSPLERAALRWFLLSIYLATGLFAGVIIIPAALGIPPPASQGVMFGAFLLMYWGLALGVIRYRLFDIARWWRAIWWWFLGGVMVVVLDILLVAMLTLSDAMALSIAVATVGWIYFPLRQWLWSRFGVRRERHLAEWLPDVLPILIGSQHGASGEDEIRARWPGALQAVFRPLAVEAQPGGLAAPEIREHGLVLALPDLRTNGMHLLLRHVDGGQRLFDRGDLGTLDALHELFELALDRLRSRDAGARIERERIRRDVHDDLGARLLTLLHTTGEAGQPIVREAIEDLRSLLRALEQDRLPLRDAVDGWQAEARKRADAAGVELRWQTTELPAGHALNTRQHANLTRVVREATSNALRHARPASIDVHIATVASAGGETLQLRLSNDGDVKPLAHWSTGRGRQIMQGRVSEIGGRIDWRTREGTCELCVEVPLGTA